MLTIEQRLTNLENLVDHLSKQVSNNKFYTDADMQGNRQSISNVTPYTETKTAYIGDTEITFGNVPSGNISVFGLNTYIISREMDIVTISFPALNEVTDITISVL